MSPKVRNDKPHLEGASTVSRARRVRAAKVAAASSCEKLVLERRDVPSLWYQMLSTRYSIVPVLAVLVCLAVAPVPLLATDANSNSALGLWKNEDATFEIFDDGGKLSAKIVALREPLTPEGKEKTDIHNPDASKHGRPIVGLVFMSGFTAAAPGKWEHGTIYDPKTGNTYSCNMELQGPNRINVRGFVGISLIGRTDVWTRVK